MGNDRYRNIAVSYRDKFKWFVYVFGTVLCVIFSWYAYFDKGWLYFVGMALLGGVFFSNSIDFLIRETIQRLKGENNLGLILGYFISIAFYVVFLCIRYSGSGYPKTGNDYYNLLIILSLLSYSGAFLLNSIFKRFSVGDPADD